MYTGWLLTSAVNLTCRTCTQTWLSFTSDHAERTIVLISVDSSITFISNAGTAHTLVCDSYYNNFNSSPSRHTLIINRVSLAASILSFIVFIIAFVYAYSFSTSFVLSASSLTCFWYGLVGVSGIMIPYNYVLLKKWFLHLRIIQVHT